LLLRELRCISPYLDFKTASTTATSIVPLSFILNLPTVILPITTFQNVNLTGSINRSKIFLRALLRPHSIILASCKPGRKHVESQLQTCLKRFIFYIPSVSMRTNQRTCCGSRPGFRQKKSRKRVANPHDLVENLAANQVCS